MRETSRYGLIFSDVGGFWDWSANLHALQVMKTQRAIKHALTERMYTWQDAIQVAMSDPEINLEGGEGQVYTPSAYEDEYDGEDWAKAEAAEVEGEVKNASPIDAAVPEAGTPKTDKEVTR